MKKVTVFTTFINCDFAYSLTTVTANQLKMLVRHGYNPQLVVCDSFEPKGIFAHDAIRIKKIPNLPLRNDGNFGNDFNDLVGKIEEPLTEILKDQDVCITHDIIYQLAHLPHNKAARNVAKKYPDLRWLHWMHSGPDERQNVDEPKSLRFTRFPNSFVVYPNKYDKNRVAKMYDIELDEVKCVYHPIDIADYLNFTDLTKKLLKEKNILQADIIGTYPLRLDRGKQPHYNVKIFAKLKELGRSVALIIADFHSTGGDKAKYRDEMKTTAINLGLSEHELIFTSELDEKLKVRCPREMIRDLMLLSNIFVLPSKSETYSLIAQEAAICKNLLVLNHDFPPMRSIYGEDVIYKQFSSDINALTNDFGQTKTETSNEYFEDIAKSLIYWLENDKAIATHTKIRKERNLDAIWRDQLEPLIYYEE